MPLSASRDASHPFILNGTPFTRAEILQFINQRLDANIPICIEDNLIDMLEDDVTVARVRAWQARPKIIPFADLPERAATVTMVAEIMCRSVANQRRVWAGRTNTAVRFGDLLTHGSNATKLCRVWFPWGQAPPSPTLIDVYLEQLHLSSVLMDPQTPVEINLSSIPAVFTVRFASEYDGPICMDFIDEANNRLLCGKITTAFVRHWYTDTGVLDVQGEQLVCVQILHSHAPAGDFEVLLNGTDRVPLALFDPDTRTYHASVSPEANVVNDGPVVHSIHTSHPSAMAVKTKTMLCFTVASAVIRERQEAIEQLRI